MHLLSNQPIIYHSCLDDRRFEEFINDLYLQDLNEGNYGNKFDDVTVLSGVREQGRDCVLHKNGNNVGVIQCKLYNRPLDKPESTKEIIKFCLYSILNPNFIFDKDTFEYHFVSSCGFNDTAHLYLKNFSSQIIKEEKLDNWIKEVIQKNKTLTQVRFDDIKAQILDILCSIKIIPVIGNELDRRLSFEHNENLLSKYFEVKAVVDLASLVPIRESIEEIKTKLLPSIEYSINELKTASFSLYMSKNYFGNLKDSFIERKEKIEIINWIDSAINQTKKDEYNNILFLTGSAGCGKTTLLRSVFENLQANGIPVLGLKSDSLIAISLEELRQKINFTHPIVKSLTELSKQNYKVVILIDQIDALSQYHSANREYINTYIQLIESLKGILNIRVIVSVREYDLNYDFSLQPYKNLKKVELGNLQDEAVETVLSKIGLSRRDLSSTLFELLKNPNNLDVFCRVYNKEANIHEIRTLQDLYFELWKQLFAEKNIDKTQLKTFLFTIVERQNQQQQISVLIYNIENYSIEYNFLKSKGIIIENEDQSFRFFHQSFYDFVFAKSFVDQGLNVIKYLKDNKQSFLIRSGLKMILSYISILDVPNYIAAITYILKSPTIKFHIKSLTISLLANIENPLNEEKIIVEKIIIPDTSYYLIFLDNLISIGWMNLLIGNGFLQNLYQIVPNKRDRFLSANNKLVNNLINTSFFKNYILFDKRKNLFQNIATYMVRRNLKSNSDTILSFFMVIEFPEKGLVVGNILYSLKRWENPLAFNLFTIYKKSIDTFSYNKILEDIIPYNVDFVINELKDSLYDSIFKEHNGGNDWYDKKKILDLINETNPQKSIDFFWNIVLNAIKCHEHLWIDPEDKLLVPDGLFNMFSVVENNHSYHSDKERIFARLIKWIKAIHESDPDYFEALIKDNYESKYQSIVKIVICVLDKNESKYESTVIAIIDRFYEINRITEHGELQGDLFRLIEKWFPYFKDNNKEHVLQIILSLRNQGRIESWIREGEKRIYSSFGLTTCLFLKAIPIDYIYSNKDAKKIYLELIRKFPETKPADYLYSSRFRMGGVRSPIKTEAYHNMTNKQWIKSFLKYKDDKIQFDFVGGREEHARRLEEEIKKRPSDFVELFLEMVSDNLVHESYIALSLYAFSESAVSNEILENIFVAAISQRKFSNEKLFYVTLGLKKAFIKGIENDLLIEFANELAVSFENPKLRNDRDLYSTSINSVKGSALEALFCLDMMKYGKVVIDSIQKIIPDANEEILSSIVYHIAHLNKYNIEKAFQVFLSIIEKASDELFVWSFNSVQYYVHHDFSRLGNYLIRAQKIENENFRRNISAMLYFAWVRNYPKAEQYLFQHIANDTRCIAEVIHYAITNFYFEKDIQGEKALYILNKYINVEDEHISHQYDCCFLHYKEAEVTFKDLYSFIIRYVQSKSLNSKKYYVLEYLIENSAKYADECLLIFKKMKLNEYRRKTDNEFSSTIKEKQIELLMGFYNLQSKQSKPNKKNIKYLDNVFNQLFADLSYKSHIDKALDLDSK